MSSTLMKTKLETFLSSVAEGYLSMYSIMSIGMSLEMRYVCIARRSLFVVSPVELEVFLDTENSPVEAFFKGLHHDSTDLFYGPPKTAMVRH